MKINKYFQPIKSVFKQDVAKILKGFQVAIAATVMFAGSSFALAADNDGETTKEIAPGVYSFAPNGSHYFSMFVVTDDGVAAFETVNSKHIY